MSATSEVATVAKSLSKLKRLTKQQQQTTQTVSKPKTKMSHPQQGPNECRLCQKQHLPDGQQLCNGCVEFVAHLISLILYWLLLSKDASEWAS